MKQIRNPKGAGEGSPERNVVLGRLIAGLWGRVDSDGSFPLTPSPSLGEREPRKLGSCKSEALVYGVRRAMILLLPKGEGWGEGEQAVHFSKASSIAGAPWDWDLSRRSAGWRWREPT